MTTETMRCMRNHRTWVGRALLVGALAVVLVGAGCKNPFRKNPEQVLRTASERWAASDAVRMHVQAKVDARGSDPKEWFTVDLVADGTGTSTGVSSQGEVSATFTFDADPLSGRIALDERVVGGVIYFRLQDFTLTPKAGAASSDLPPVAFDAIAGMVKGAIGGKWVKLDPRELASLDPSMKKSDVAEMEALFTPEKQRVLREQMQQALKTQPLFAFREDLGNASVGKTSAYHYRVALRPEAIEAVVTAIAPTLGASSAEDLRKLRNVLTDPTTRSAIAGTVGEMWIAKRSNDILKLTFPINANLPDDVAKLTGTVEITYSDFGKPVTVEVPADAKTIQDLFGNFLGASSGLPTGDDDVALPRSGTLAPSESEVGLFGGKASVSSVGMSGSGDQDDDGLSDSEEAFYGSNPAKPDTDGDGFTDGDEVERGYSPTEKGKKLFSVDLDGQE